ncbi:peptide chain release factor 1 [Candidatus Gracilibacteria bacterium]|nr:peptide chain release factor 1 [Candidatus Gracilibacteria bacterium]MCF7856695.1 peptide chain release factor 1 [Candidatus Gracilibacteria bacterium]MCF7897005.1 peptide chain release factor 1 [Candidatus Gracilibacteria bacterium]
MIEKVNKLLVEFQGIENQLSSPENVADQKKFRELSIRHAQIAENIDLLRSYAAAWQNRVEADEILKSGDVEMKEIAEEQKIIAEKQIEELEEELKIALLPRDENEGKNVIVEIRAGTGGEEAALFAAELARAYLRFAESENLKTEILSKSEAEAGGIKEIIFRVEGNCAYQKFKFEAGTHRVQRIPATESKGRIHTSAVTVAVLPEAEEVDIEIKPDEIRVDTFCSSGPGGQSVNTTYSAIRITHLATGLIVSQQDEKSQIKNRAKAMQVLRSRLLALKQEEAARERGELRSGMIGSGDRSEKIRTYNFPQDRITDHRIGRNFSNLPKIMEGNLAEIIAELRESEIAEKIKSN